jgi:flavodoxin
MKVLNLYFSATGNTEKVAKQIASHVRKRDPFHLDMMRLLEFFNTPGMKKRA